MPSIGDNLNVWSNYDWSKNGDEWSWGWGGSEYLWWGTIFPRIHPFLPAGSILEIAPGFGRCTQFLKNFCDKLIVVDLTEACIESCKKRFSTSSNIQYYINDGKSLEMIPNESVDFVFSWDSLVHAEKDVLESYIYQLSKKLKPDGVGFIHHSNLGSLPEDVRSRPDVAPHWRSSSMSCKLFEEYCNNVNLQCVCQELIPWGQPDFIDCFSLFTHKNSRYSVPNKVLEHNFFQSEQFNLVRLSELYSPLKRKQ